MNKTLVTGATGKQGGAVAHLLLERGRSVRAMTRHPDSPAARALAERGAEIVKGDLTDRAAMDSAIKGTDAVFLVTTPYQSSTADETKQGLIAADAAKAVGAYVVFTSVANADRHTGIPHFDSKFEVEKHLRAIGSQAAIIAPVFFMENMMFGRDQLKQGVYGLPLPPNRKLAQIAVADIAAAAVAALEDPSRYAGKRYDLAGDEVSGEEAARILSDVAGRPFRFVQVPLDVIRKARGEDGVVMYKWFETTGYAFDRPQLTRDFPSVKWATFEAWAKRLPKDVLAAGQ